MTPTPPEVVITTQQATDTMKAVLAVEKNAPNLSGPTKAAIVLDTVNTVATQIPTILSLIQMMVSIFNATGWFRKKAK